MTDIDAATLALTLTVALVLGDSAEILELGDAEVDAVSEAVILGETVDVNDALSEAVPDKDGEDEDDIVALGEADALALALDDDEADDDEEYDGKIVGDGDSDGVLDSVDDVDVVGVIDIDADGVTVSDSELELDTVVDGTIDGDTDNDADGEEEIVDEGDDDAEQGRNPLPPKGLVAAKEGTPPLTNSATLVDETSVKALPALAVGMRKIV